MRAFLPVMLLMAAGSSARAECSGFKDGAEAFASASFHTKFTRKGSKTDYKKAVVEWEPTSMLDDLGCYEIENTELMYKTPSMSGWENTGVTAQNSKWTVDIKPCLQYQFKIMVNSNSLDGEGAQLTLPQTVGPATPDQLSASGYIPEAATNFGYDSEDYSANLSWDGADCTSSYYVTYQKSGSEEDPESKDLSGSESGTTITNLNACSSYDVNVYAYGYSEEDPEEVLSGTVATKPTQSPLDSMEVKTNPGQDSVQVSFKTSGSVSCIKNYNIKICEPGQDCAETKTVQKSDAIDFISETVEGLKQCTDYQMMIEPQYTGMELESKSFDFRTASPDAADLRVQNVVTEQGAGTSVKLSWDPLPCASQYKIFQKMTGDDWMEVGITESADEVSFDVDSVAACTEYTFAISAMLGEDETEKTEGESIISKLDPHQKWTAPSLNKNPSDSSATIEWAHANCIDSYKILLSEPGYSDKKEISVSTDNLDGSTMRHTIENLKPCTPYTFQIVPTGDSGEEISNTNEESFSTTNGEPQAPTGIQVDPSQRTVSMNWQPAQCATGYTVYWTSADGTENSEEVEKDQLRHTINDLTPCDEYTFEVVTRVGEQMSARTTAESYHVPPVVDQPVIEILTADDTKPSVTVNIKPSPTNEICKVSHYHVRYAKDATTYKQLDVSAADLTDGALVLDTTKNAYVLGSISYDGFAGIKSEQTARGEIGAPKSIPQVQGMDTKILYPTVVGVAVLAVIVIVVTVLVLRRKKTMRSFDAEKGVGSGNSSNGTTSTANGKSTEVKAENGKKANVALNGNDEETQKLNADHNDPENFA